MDLQGSSSTASLALREGPGELKQVELWSLVLQAVHIKHKVVQEQGGWVIHVKEQDYDSALKQISIFEAENRGWPPQPPPSEPMGSDDLGTLFFMLSLVLFFSVTGPWEGKSDWFLKGAVSADKIFGGGEWWRLFTGLTLHADAAHLLGNVFFGGVLLYFLCSQLGSGTGWMIAIISGGGGNLLNIWFRHGGHLSVGFSTAVFGMVGAFCGMRWFRRGLSFQEFILPIGAAAALLAFMGTAGERTDLGAHFWGMAVGLVLGWAAGRHFFKVISSSRFIQGLLAAICLGCIWLSWFLALSQL